MKTYSSRPFISHDAPDENGVRAEVRVITGYGDVHNITETGSGKAAKVEFSVDNTRFNSSGHVPTDSNVLEKVRAAQEAGEPIHFRIESRRQNHIDRSLPIEELTQTADKARDSIYKNLTAVKLEEDDEWTVSQYAVTNMKEDPKSGGIYSAADMSIDDLQKNSKNSDKNAFSPASYSGIEAPPYVARNRNGDINPGSIAVSVPLNLLAFVAEWDRDNPDDQVGEKKRVAVVKTLLSAANELQMKIYDGELESPDLNAGSHTRARALLFDVIKSYYPLGADIVETKETLNEWRDRLVEKAFGMWKWSISEVESVSS